MNEVISVKEFLEIVSETLSFAYPGVTVEGEVSGLKVWKERFVYFDLMDDEAKLSCFVVLAKLRVELADGMKVKVMGTPKLTKQGKFSFSVHTVELSGEGSLLMAFELLKSKLEAEGLFELARKRELPRFPSRIGLVTSLQADAYFDFIRIFGERWGAATIVVAETQVQGAVAPEQISAAIQSLNQLADPPEVIAVVRGGGSLEDLAAYNTEMVARAIAGSRAPVVTGVGHEQDVTISDLVADKRGATPTHAAEIIAPNLAELQSTITHICRAVAASLTSKVALYEHLLDGYSKRLERFWTLPGHKIAELERSLGKFVDRATGLSREVQVLIRVLGGLDPKQVLKRGYAVVKFNNKVIKTPKLVRRGDLLVIQLAEGNLGAVVDE